LTGALPARPARPPADAARERLLELLAREPESSGDRQVVQELVALGSAAIAPAIEVLAGSAAELESDAARAAHIERRKALLWDALAAWPEGAVMERTQPLMRGDVDEVLLGVRILARCGPPRAARTILTAVCELEPEQRARTRVQLELERGLGAIVARDASCTWQLSEQIDAVPPELRPAVARGLGQTLRHGGVLLLERMLGQSLELDQIVLAQLANIDPRDRQTVRQELAARLDRYLDHADARLRGQAALSLGRLHDFGSVERLIALLEAGGTEGRAALQALQLMAGVRWPGEARRWKDWLRKETAWLAQALPALAQDVSATDPGRAALALRELGPKSHLRDQIAPSLVAALGHPDPAVVRLACSVAAATRCDAALGALAQQLAHADESVREASVAALRSLSGEPGPPDADWWQAWLRG
jgi:hypothetical protein